MLKSQKHVFWEAFLITILIFGIGIFFGVLIENWRTKGIDDFFQKSEVDLLDIKLQNEIYSRGDFNCETAVYENLKFADRIYEEAKLLDRYEKASKLTENIQLEHKKYDILRAMLLLNSIKIQEKCNKTYYEVVYFYRFNNPQLELKAKQNVFSKLLTELKDRKGGDILLIPIAADTEASSINMILDRYNISKEELPLILINREIKITEIQNIEELVKYFE